MLFQCSQAAKEELESVADAVIPAAAASPDIGAASSGVGVQVKPMSKETSVQSECLHTQDVEVQTDACDINVDSETSSDELVNADSDVSYEPDDDTDEDESGMLDCEIDNAVNLERMRRLCKKNPKEYMGLNKEGLCVLELIARNIKGICMKQSQSKLTAFDVCCMVMVKLKAKWAACYIEQTTHLSQDFAF